MQGKPIASDQAAPGSGQDCLQLLLGSSSPDTPFHSLSFPFLWPLLFTLRLVIQSIATSPRTGADQVRKTAVRHPSAQPPDMDRHPSVDRQNALGPAPAISSWREKMTVACAHDGHNSNSIRVRRIANPPPRPVLSRMSILEIAKADRGFEQDAGLPSQPLDGRKDECRIDRPHQTFVRPAARNAGSGR